MILVRFLLCSMLAIVEVLRLSWASSVQRKTLSWLGHSLVTLSDLFLGLQTLLKWSRLLQLKHSSPIAGHCWPLVCGVSHIDTTAFGCCVVCFL